MKYCQIHPIWNIAVNLAFIIYLVLVDTRPILAGPKCSEKIVECVAECNACIAPVLDTQSNSCTLI